MARKKPTKAAPPKAAVPAKPAEPAKLEKIEDAHLEAETILATVEARLMSGEVTQTSFGGHPNDKELYEARQRTRDLIQQVGAFLAPKANGWEQGDAGKFYLADQTAVKPGGDPSWTRRCEVVIWLDTIPIRCIWGGWFDPTGTSIAPIDSAELFPANFPSMGAAFGVAETIRDSFRVVLANWSNHVSYDRNKRVPSARLGRLSTKMKEAADAYLQDNAWLREIVRRGPVDAMHLPPHLQTVQLSLA
jgi:hypothetical protein